MPSPTISGTSCDETDDSATDDAELDRFSCAACSTMAASSSLKSSMISGDGMENCSIGSSVLHKTLCCACVGASSCVGGVACEAACRASWREAKCFQGPDSISRGAMLESGSPGGKENGALVSVPGHPSRPCDLASNLCSLLWRAGAVRLSYQRCRCGCIAGRCPYDAPEPSGSP